MRGCRREPVRAVGLALGLALLSVALPAAGEPASWYPLAVGDEWVYREHSDRSLEPEEGLLRRSFKHASVTEKVVGERPAQDGVPVFELLRTAAWREPEGGGAEERSTLLLSSGSGGVRLHGLRVDEGLRAGGLRYDYEPPVRMLPPAADPSGSWRAGTLRRPGIEVVLSARVMGREELEIAGVSYADCLRVRYEGAVKSEVEGPRGRLSLEGGRYSSDVWFVRGVGIVQEVAEIRGDLTGGDDQVVRMTDITRRRLERHVPAR